MSCTLVGIATCISDTLITRHLLNHILHITNDYNYRNVKYAMNLFKKYDADKSGEIDKAEFREIAKEIQADARRRNLISVAAAAIGAVSYYDVS